MPTDDGSGGNSSTAISRKRQSALPIKRLFLVAYMMGVIFVRRNPARVILEVAVPFSFLFVLFVISGGEHLHLGLAGTLIMAFGSSGIWVGMDIAENKIENRMQDIFVSSPVSSITYLTGIALTQLLVALVPLSIIAGIVI